jgi:mono/diheme cytochrome c family protein
MRIRSEQINISYARLALGLALVFALCITSGCHRDMRDQPRYEAQEPTTFFPDGRSDRLPVTGTIARGQLDSEDEFHTGKVNGRFTNELPLKVDRALLERGQERFHIYCAPCHSRTGLGDGIIVQRGFQHPPSLHLTRLRQAPVGHFFDVMTHGFGAMPRYAVQVTPRDRWAIAAYIRVLQLSQNATLQDVPAEIRAQLNKEQP